MEFKRDRKDRFSKRIVAPCDVTGSRNGLRLDDYTAGAQRSTYYVQHPYRFTLSL